MFGRGTNNDQKSSPSPMTPPRDFASASSPMMTPSKPASVIGSDLAIVGQHLTSDLEKLRAALGDTRSRGAAKAEIV